MGPRVVILFASGAMLWTGCNRAPKEAVQAEMDSLKACAEMASGGFRPIADTRDLRFLGKVQAATAVCRGGAATLPFRMTPWVDWANYWGAADDSSRTPAMLKRAGVAAPDERGILGA